MEPVAPIGPDSYLPIPPDSELERVLFAGVQINKVYYVKHRNYVGQAWSQRLEWLLVVVKNVTDRVIGSPVWYLARNGCMRPWTTFSAEPVQIDTDNEGREYYHCYVPQEPVSDPTAVAPAAVPVAAPVAAVGGAGAPPAPAAAAVGNNAAGDPVAPRRLPSRKRKNSRRSSRRSSRRNQKNRRVK